MTFQTDKEHIAFLEQQLSGAVMYLRQLDRTDKQIADRYEKIFKDRFMEAKNAMDKAQQKLKEQFEEIKAHAFRYALLRRYVVRVRELGILAEGSLLDHKVDEIIRQESKKSESVTH